jgi:hypothetical protein
MRRPNCIPQVDLYRRQLRERPSRNEEKKLAANQAKMRPAQNLRMTI